jgi:hypothetical protein
VTANCSDSGRPSHSLAEPPSPLPVRETIKRRVLIQRAFFARESGFRLCPDSARRSRNVSDRRFLNYKIRETVKLWA